MNINKLKGKMVEKEISAEQLAEFLGIHVSSLYRKFGNAEKITVGEAIKIKAALELDNADACEIFLN